MIVSQTFRTAGFRAQLSVRGHTLHVQPDGPDLPALLQPAVSENADYQLSQETTVTDIANVLREDLAGAVIAPGVVLAEGSARYRVVKVEDHPVDVAVKLHCEVVNL